MVNHLEDDGSLSGSGFTSWITEHRGASHRRDLKVEGCWELTAHRPEALFSRSFCFPYAGCIPSSPDETKTAGMMKVLELAEGKEEEKSRERTLGLQVSPFPARCPLNREHRLCWSPSSGGTPAREMRTGPQVPQLAAGTCPNHQEAEV